jgi:hypothetical protein
MSTYNIHRELAKLEWWVRRDHEVTADLRDAATDSRSLGGEITVHMECVSALREMVSKRRREVVDEIAGMFEDKS